jgi:hypothetical protein
MNAICALDSAIYTLDPTATLTDDAFCVVPALNKCPSWQKLPKKLPGFEAAHWDVRIYLFLIYKEQCVHQACKYNLKEIVLVELWTWEPEWRSDKKLKQKRIS